MIRRRVVLCLTACAAMVPILAGPPAAAGEGPYFPPTGSRNWTRSDPAANGWNTKALEDVFDYAQVQGSTGIVIVQRGRIIAERYWSLTPARGQASGRFAALHHGETPEGWPIEDVASIQKSVISVLIGMAWNKGLIDIEKPVSSYLGDGWSRAPRDKEAAITVHHLLAMASGLDRRLRYESPAGTRWFYNTPAYGKLDDVLERAAGRKIGDITQEWLTGPLGMTDSRWEARTGRFVDANNIGFVTTPRDLARLGVLLLNGGTWDGRDVIASPDWLKASFSPSQSDYPGYGYLWWLNSGGFAANSNPAAPRFSGWFVPAAPADMIAARGHFDRRLYIVPSLSLVVVRLGLEADTRRFDQDFWPHLARAIPKATGSGTAAARAASASATR